MKYISISLIIFFSFFSVKKTEGQVRKYNPNDSTACTFFVHPDHPSFAAVTSYYAWLQDRHTTTDSSKNTVSQYRKGVITITAYKPANHYDRTIETIIERHGRLVDSVVIRKSSKLEQEDWVSGGYKDPDTKVMYSQGDIKYREAGDGTLIIRKYHQLYHPASESGYRR